MEQKDWLWVETLFKRIKIPYQLICISLVFFIYFFYLFFGKMINVLPLNFNAQLSAISMSLLIPFMLGGIQYLNNKRKCIIARINDIADISIRPGYLASRNWFTNSCWRYVFMILIIAPFYIVDWISPFQGTLWDHLKEMYLPIYEIPKFHTVWGLSFDIYIQALGLVSLILLSYILLIIFNITWVLRNWENSSFEKALDESVFNIKADIIFIKSLILKILLFYFTIISLTIISYLNPSVFFSKESAMLLILLLIGISFFFLGLNSIQQALKYQIEFQLYDINKLYKEKIREVMIAASNNGQNRVDDLNTTLIILDFFRKQKEDLEKISTNIYDYRSVLRFIGMTILPFIASIFKAAIYNNWVVDAIKTELASKINNTAFLIINKSVLNFFVSYYGLHPR